MIDDDDDGDDEPRTNSAHILREIGIAHLGFRVGKPFSAWKTDVRNDYGEVNERQLYRALSWLITNGLARRSDERVDWDNRSSGTEERAYLYFRTTDHIPEIPVVERVVRCTECGKVGVTIRSHQPDGTHLTPVQLASASRARHRHATALRLADAVALWRKQAAEAIEQRRTRRSSKPARHRRRASRAA